MHGTIFYLSKQLGFIRVLIKQSFKLVFFLVLTGVIGCGDPTLHPITGRVTLDGKSYNRLMVYMDPESGEIDRFNRGVGETDAEGNLKLAAGGSKVENQGLVTGKYKVYFKCWVKKDGKTGLEDGKGEAAVGRWEEPVNIVPAPYDSLDGTPVTFEVKAGQDNVFVFDIPSA